MFWRRYSRKIAALRRACDSGAIPRQREASSALCDVCREDGDEVAGDALPLLERMLRNPDAAVGEAAMYGFGYCGDDALRALLRLLDDRDSRVRERALHAIANGKMDRADARPALLAALADEVAEVRGMAAFALGLIPDTSTVAVDAVANLSRDAIPSVRSAALHALGNMARADDAPRALSAHLEIILAALDELDDRVHESASYAFEGLQLPASRVLSTITARLTRDPRHGARGLFGALEQLGGREDLAPHLGTLVELARQHPGTRFAVYRLGRRFGRRAQALVPMIEHDLAVPDSDVISLGEALLEISGRADAALPRLTALLDGDMSDASRAGKLLVAITGDGARIVPMLERALAKSPDEPAALIAELGPAVSQIAPALARCIDEYYDEPDWDVMWALTDAMSSLQSPDPVSIAALCKALKHDSGAVKGSAMAGLARLGPAARPALPELRQLLAQHDDADFTKAVREVMFSIDRNPH